MKTHIFLKRKRIETKFIEHEEGYSVPVWWFKFLRWLFYSEWVDLKFDMIRSATESAERIIKEEMKSYKRQIDEDILRQIEIAEPAIKAKKYSDLDLPDLAPSPVIINGIAYPKRIVTRKDAL